MVTLNLNKRVLNLLFSVFASGLPLVVLPGANASDIQRLAPERIIAANCGTCHGFDLMGGTSWVNGESTNQIAGLDVRRIISVARSGLLDTSMPAFGRPRLTDAELAELARYISIHPQGVPVPSRPQGRPVQLNIEDETPWFQSDGTDLNTGDRRRLVLAPDQYVHEINHGQTWHTVTSDANLGKDSGWIGLNGTFDAVQGDDLAEGCNVYHCHIHPYMQVEICVGEARPKPLTRIYKNPLDYAPDVATYGEDVLVAAQTQHTDTDNRNGYLQVISTTDWTVKKVVPNVVNNVHFPFWGKDALGKPVVMLGTFHDNKVTSLDPATYQVIGQAPIGVTSAHVMPLTDGSGLWASMLNGGDAIVLLDPVLMENGLNPIVNTIRATPDQIQDGPHGMWPCSPGYGNLFLAGNMFSNTISLWDLDAGVLADWVSTGGVMPMNPHVLAGFGGGCRRAFANNFQTNDVSFFDIDPVAKKVTRIPLTGPLANAAGNLALTDLSLTPPRWARSTIQGVASPQDSTTHGQWLFMSSKGYMGEFAIKLDNEGLPIQVYSLPVGLGAHGIAFVRKKTCRTNDPADVCYLVALAGSWADHVEFYDMEALETDLGAPGSAPDSVHVEGYLVEQWCSSKVAQLLALGIDCTSLPAGPYGRIINKLPLTVLCPDCRSGAHVGDVLLQKTTNNSYAYFKSPLIEYWSDGSGGVDGPVDLELLTNSGTFNLAASPTVYAPFK